jgi:hypothetical protein
VVVSFITGGNPGENHWPAASQWQTLTHLAMSGIRTHTFSGTNCI